jgi:hypothetical protein
VTRSEGERVEVARAKGRPMLSWVGKRPLREVQAFPSQLVERFAPDTPDGIVAGDVDWTDWPERFDRGGLLFHGDNKEVLAHLLATGFRGKVDLVYIDPPFDSGADGDVFDVDLVDMPARRSDVVDGTYDLDAPAGDRLAAVRITDMLGEEILVVENRSGR